MAEVAFPDKAPTNDVAVIVPVILIVPVPLIVLLLRSKLPPSCGVVSFTISDIPPETLAQVLSPLKNTLLLAVPDPSLAVGTVPDPKLDALSAVKLAPLPEKFVAVTSPVILIVPVPLIVLLLRSKLPPSCGVVSSITLLIPPPPPEGVAQVLSPLKNTVLLAVPDPSLAVGTVPDVSLVAFKSVKAAALPWYEVAVITPALPSWILLPTFVLVASSCPNTVTPIPEVWNLFVSV